MRGEKPSDTLIKEPAKENILGGWGVRVCLGLPRYVHVSVCMSVCMCIRMYACMYVIVYACVGGGGYWLGGFPCCFDSQVNQNPIRAGDPGVRV